MSALTALLVKANGRVDQREQDDTDKIGPVRRTTTAVGKRNGDKGRTLHDTGERVLHKAKKTF
jgi:hypothetical protein